VFGREERDVEGDGLSLGDDGLGGDDGVYSTG